jgi:hypothetical protein
MAAAFQDLEHAEIPGATSAINVVQRVAAPLGTALLAVVLQRAIAANMSGFHGGISEAAALARHDPQHAAPAIAEAFGTTFWFAFALTAIALVPALLLPSKIGVAACGCSTSPGRSQLFFGLRFGAARLLAVFSETGGRLRPARSTEDTDLQGALRGARAAETATSGVTGRFGGHDDWRRLRRNRSVHAAFRLSCDPIPHG